MVWQGPNAIKGGRTLLGATRPDDSLPGTIRGDLCLTVGRNIIHGSDSAEGAEHEVISIAFAIDNIHASDQALVQWEGVVRLVRLQGDLGLEQVNSHHTSTKTTWNLVHLPHILPYNHEVVALKFLIKTEWNNRIPESAVRRMRESTIVTPQYLLYVESWSKPGFSQKKKRVPLLAPRFLPIHTFVMSTKRGAEYYLLSGWTMLVSVQIGSMLSDTGWTVS